MRWRIASEIGARYPEDTPVQFASLPLIRAAIAIRSGDGRRAVGALAATSPYDFARMSQALESVAYPPYLRGEAYLLLKDGSAAAREFQKLIDHPPALQNGLAALAHLGVGRAVFLSGDAAKAKAAYDEFFALWKDADADIPILKQANAEYAKLE